VPSSGSSSVAERPRVDYAGLVGVDNARRIGARGPRSVIADADNGYDSSINVVA
jgi:hypothetical protein